MMNWFALTMQVQHGLQDFSSNIMFTLCTLLILHELVLGLLEQVQLLISKHTLMQILQEPIRFQTLACDRSDCLPTDLSFRLLRPVNGVYTPSSAQSDQ